MSLERYHERRHFDRTPEPRGSARVGATAPIFVVQLHHASHRHYDFRLQVGGVLKSWAVPKGPSFDPGTKRLAMEVEDHPLDYARFEGVIPRGSYGAGDVRIFDHGSWAAAGDPREQLRRGHLRFRLYGDKLRGEWDLVRTSRGDARPSWILRKRPDDEAGAFEADDLLSDILADEVTPAAPAAPAEMTITLSHGERVLFPEVGITKADVFAYYGAVAPWLLPEVVHRPLAIVRCTAGTRCFFQKHRTAGMGRHVHGVEIQDLGGARAEYLYIEDTDGLLELVQMGALELHPWGCTIDDVERADRVVFDLDPGPGVAWSRVVETARALRHHLDGEGLTSFVRLSGNKGLHVVVPLRPAAPWDEVKAFARHVAFELAAARPRELLATMAKRDRDGRIFIDWLRNARGATSVASYVVRRTPRASVAMPLAWRELGRVGGPRAYDLPATLRALARRQDPWAGLATLRQRLPRHQVSR